MEAEKKSNATGNPITAKPKENQAFADDLEDDLPF